MHNKALCLMELIIKIILVVIFGLAVFVKISGKTKSTFEKSKLGLPFMYFVAFAEALFTVGLFTQLELWAITGLIVILIGAIVILFQQRESISKYGMALISLILLLILLYMKVV